MNLPAVEHITALLRSEPENIRVATVGDGALSLEEATRESNIRLDFFCKLCRKQPELFKTLLAVYVEAKGVATENPGAQVFCNWVEGNP